MYVFESKCMNFKLYIAPFLKCTASNFPVILNTILSLLVSLLKVIQTFCLMDFFFPVSTFNCCKSKANMKLFVH